MRPMRETPSQTAGPFVHIGLTPSIAGLARPYGEDLGSGPLYREGVRGERITLTGRILDGAGGIVRDALVEAWQADADGLYPSPSETRGRADPAFIGWGRAAIGEEGGFTFATIMPGAVPGPGPAGTLQAPHVTLWIVARGINLGLHTRMYFPQHGEAHAADPLLSRIDPPVRRGTLIATRNVQGAGPDEADRYHLDIRLQGEGETVFLDI